MQTSTAPLTPAMVDAIKATGPEDVMAGGSTRTGLIRRGIVHPRGHERFGKLTDAGLQVRAKMLPAPAPEPEARPVVVQYAEPRGLAATATILDEAPAEVVTLAARQNGKTTAAEAAAQREPVVPEVQAATAVQEPMRHRYHGKTLGQRRSRRKAERLARRANRR